MEGDRADLRPVTSVARPSCWVALPGLGEEVVASRQEGFVFAFMALLQADVVTLSPKNVPLAECFNASKEDGNDEDSAGALHVGIQARSRAAGDRWSQHCGVGRASTAVAFSVEPLSP